MSEITHHTDYRQALAAIKQRIQTSQTRAVLAVNAELLGLYWDIGRQLAVWQRERSWGRQWWSKWRWTCKPLTPA